MPQKRKKNGTTPHPGCWLVTTRISPCLASGIPTANLEPATMASCREGWPRTAGHLVNHSSSPRHQGHPSIRRSTERLCWVGGPKFLEGRRFFRPPFFCLHRVSPPPQKKNVSERLFFCQSQKFQEFQKKTTGVVFFLGVEKTSSPWRITNHLPPWWKKDVSG